jgi:predicted transposase/invertase (TIGR01784 family)
MRTGIDILFDNVKAEGIAEGIVEGIAEGFVSAALKLLAKGKSIEEVADLLDLTKEQVAEVEERAELNA